MWRNEMKHLNIAIFSHTIAFGGSERVACLLADLLSQEGYNIFFIIQHKTKFSYSINNKNITMYNLENSNNKYEGVRGIFKKENINLCIFNDHFIDETFDFIRLAHKMNIKTIAIEHSSFFFPFYALNTTNFTKRNAGYRYIDRLVVLSPMLEQMWNALNITKAIFIPNPLTFKQRHYTTTTKKEKYLIFIGRICYMKGIFEALEIIKRVSEKFENVRLLVLGRFEDDKIKKDVEKKIDELHINKNIIFTGHINNIETYLSAASIHLMPSMIEGAPMSFYEAKSFGIPTVCFDIPTLFLADESSGCIMVGKNDIEGMTDAVMKLLTDERYWKLMSERSINSLTKLDEKIIISKWNALINNIINESTKNTDNKKNQDELPHTILKEFSYAIDWYNQKNISILYNEMGYLIPFHKIIIKMLPKGSIQRTYIKKIFSLFKKIFN